MMPVIFKVPYKSFLRPTLNNGLAVGITLFILAFISLIITEGKPTDISGWIANYVASLVGATIGGTITTFLNAYFLYLANSKYPIIIDSIGLTSYDQKGSKYTFRWEEMTDISLITIEKYSFFTFKNHEEVEILVPPAIKHLQYFLDLVNENSNTLNPEFSKTFKKFIQNSEATA